jgi:hypothetical protein
MCFVIHMYRRSIAGGLDNETIRQEEESMAMSGRKSFSSVSDDFLLSVFTFFEFIECIGRMAVEVRNKIKVHMNDLMM